MDKAEYREKLEQITELVNIGDFQNAQTIVDEVDWRRVKSARTLCMVSEIYEKNNRLPDSRRVLERAYRRALVKTVAYRLVEVCLALGDIESAQDYYDDFADLAPMDNSKYVLKYRLLRAKDKPLKEQIEALEIYRDREYTEQWSYELAKLYHEDGNYDSCIAMCDDLILWFNEGPYVLKAMELKMKHTPLSPSQQEKYKIELEEQKKREKEAEEAKTPVFKHPGLVQEEEKKEVSSENVESIKEETKEEIKEEVKSDADEASEEVDNKTEEVIEKLDVAANTTVQSDSGIKLPFGKFSAGNIKSVLEKKKMQSQLADSIRNVFAGIGQKETDDSEELEEKEENVTESMKEDLSEYEIKDLEPEAVPEEKIDTSELVLEETKEVEIEEVVEEGKEENKKQEDDYADKIAEFDFEALFAETTNALAMELASGAFTQETVVNTEEEADRVIAEEIARIASEEAAERKALEEAARKEAEEAARKEAEEAARKEAEEAARREAEEAARKEAEEAARREAEEAARKEAEEAARREAEEAARKEAEEAARKEAEEAAKLEAEEAAKIALAEIEKLAAEEIARMMQEDADELLTGNVKEESKTEFSIQDELKAIFDETATSSSMEIDEQENMEVAEEEIEEPIVKEESIKKLNYVPVEARPLTEEEKNIFTYFAEIPGLSQQITETLCDVHNNAGDKTSKSGNFLVIGRPGSGKTRLYESMVLAICKDLDIEAAKNAKILATEFNKKDPATVVAKLAGGFLAIEGAGELSDEAAEKLAQAMEFRTDSLIVVLEDEKTSMYNLLEKHPKLAEKFTSVIKIPVFTNDELVTFARIYAQEQGYSIDEMGILALYTKIGENQKDAEPITVGNVKNMLDAAMLHANKGHRKLSRRFSKNAVDDENRIILLEKDFE